MPDSAPNGSSIKDIEHRCPLLEVEMQRRFIKHLNDLDELRNAQTDSTKKMGELASTQTALNSTLLSINSSLTDGFALGVKVVRLFGMVVMVFLVALVILSLVVIYIAHLTIDYKDLHIRQSTMSSETTVTP